MTALRKLEAVSSEFENAETGMTEDWLNCLLAPGSSLGGARPKATVQGADGSLWIAKFPSKHDEYDSGAWEKTVHDLAVMCGLSVPNAGLERFSDRGSTYIVKRFDRNGDKRIHFSSAMTLLGKTDGTESVSYLDIAEFISAYGCRPKEDLKELWKRIVFSMAVSNTDDHLRNHGFLYNEGWRLSPMYDVNPVPYGETLFLNVSADDPSIDIKLALETADYYNLEGEEAEKEAESILGTVRTNWEKCAKSNGISRESVEYMRPAFDLCHRR